MFHKVELAPDREQRYHNLTRMLFENTTKPLPLPGQKSMTEYADVLLGPNMRWETIGSVAASLSLGRGTRQLNKKNAIEELSKPPSWKAIIDATNCCLNFCTDMGSLNDVLMWFLAENTIVLTLFYGDASHPAWKRVGDLSSCLFALGLHQQSKMTPDVPRWLVELRKHNVIFAYGLDKSIAVFVGRPPRIRCVQFVRPFLITPSTIHAKSTHRRQSDLMPLLIRATTSDQRGWVPAQSRNMNQEGVL